MSDSEIIIGRNTVREALKSGRSIDAVLVEQNAADGSLRELTRRARERGVAVKYTPRRKLDELARPFGFGGRTGNHQGIIALLPGVEYATIDDVFARAEARGEAPFFVALDGVTDPQNLGAVVRSAEVLGAHGVIIPTRRSASMNAAACKTASGAEEYLPVVRVGNLALALAQLQERGVWVAAADMAGTPADEANLTGALCLVIGAEGEGVSRLIREKSDFVVGIETRGQVESLNASAAAAVLIYEKMRQEKRLRKVTQSETGE